MDGFVTNQEEDCWVDSKWVCKKLGIRHNTLWGDGTKDRLGLVDREDFPQPFRQTRRGKWYLSKALILQYMEKTRTKYPYTRRLPQASNDNELKENVA
jgi:hypothetical protein